MTSDATAIGALATAVVALAGTVTACLKLMKDMATMGKIVKQMQSQGLSGSSSCPTGTDTNPGLEGCAPLREVKAQTQTELEAIKDDVAEVKTDVKQILWHMVNGSSPGAKEGR